MDSGCSQALLSHGGLQTDSTASTPACPAESGRNLATRGAIAKFWLEVLVCCGHVPPFVTFEVGLDNWSNFVLYRAETIGAVYATLRVYVVWMVLRDWCDGWHISK